MFCNNLYADVLGRSSLPEDVSMPLLPKKAASIPSKAGNIRTRWKTEAKRLLKVVQAWINSPVTKKVRESESAWG
jgi:hypothetical protein